MSRVTSIDTLIERVWAAYPRKRSYPDRILELMGQNRYAEVYNLHSNGSFSRDRKAFSSREILATVDTNGNIIADKFAELIEKTREDHENQELEPVRCQLQEDFQQSYEFDWTPDF